MIVTEQEITKYTFTKLGVICIAMTLDYSELQIYLFLAF